MTFFRIFAGSFFFVAFLANAVAQESSGGLEPLDDGPTEPRLLGPPVKKVKPAKKKEKKVKATPPPAPEEKTSLLAQVLKDYKKKGPVKAKVQRIVKMTLVGKETNGDGELDLYNGKLRWEYNTPEKNVVIFDGQALWTIQYAPEEMHVPPQVTKAYANGPKKDQILFSLFLGKNSLLDVFDVKSEVATGDVVTYQLVPKKDKMKVKNFQVQVDKSKKWLKQIKYTDDAENETELNFKETKFGGKPNKSKFVFTLPKGAQINEL